MYRYKRILVCVSLNKQDGTSIRYASMLSRLAKSERITFLHVAGNLEIDEELCKIYPELEASCDSSTAQEIEKLVKNYYDGYPGTRLDCITAKGSPLVEILRRVKDDDIDLVVMRKKKGDKTSGNLSTKLARKSPCSVLFVPEGAGSWYTNILVPVDFSENSRDAMEVAVAFAWAGNIKEIHCLNIFQVPIGYYKTGKSYEQFAEIMKGHAEKKFQEFIKDIDLKDIRAVPKFRLAGKGYRGIWEVILEEEEVQLLIMGARGRKHGAGVLLGSVTEHLITTTAVPLIAVKKKGTGMGLLDALLEM
ncbi:MAG: universal stress protein [Deltaproteobacteria bacterium]|nr:universal stress protein [Deltaproteobacteria bacterium]